MTASTSYADDSMHVTLVKNSRKQPGEASTTIKKELLYDPNIFQVCRIRHDSEADIETDFSWIITEAMVVNGGCIVDV